MSQFGCAAVEKEMKYNIESRKAVKNYLDVHVRPLVRSVQIILLQLFPFLLNVSFMTKRSCFYVLRDIHFRTCTVLLLLE